MVLRVSGGSSILRELSNEDVTVAMEDALRLGVSAVALSIFVGAEFEKQTLVSLARLVDEGQRYGMPVLAVTAVGKDMARDARYLGLACRIAAEMGAHLVKTYHCEDFESVVRACPIPIIVAGREEDLGAGRAEAHLRRRGRGCRGRGHGPQHLPVRGPGGDDPRGPGGGPREGLGGGGASASSRGRGGRRGSPSPADQPGPGPFLRVGSMMTLIESCPLATSSKPRPASARLSRCVIISFTRTRRARSSSMASAMSCGPAA